MTQNCSVPNEQRRGRRSATPECPAALRNGITMHRVDWEMFLLVCSFHAMEKSWVGAHKAESVDGAGWPRSPLTRANFCQNQCLQSLTMFGTQIERDLLTFKVSSPALAVCFPNSTARVVTAIVTRGNERTRTSAMK